MLDNYLNNLRYYFRREEGAEEIVRDIENRIGELFDEYLRNGQQVITVENVEAVIERMGKPEQLDEEIPRIRNLLPEPDVKKDLAVCSVIRTTGFWQVWFPQWARRFQPGSHVGMYCSYSSSHSGSWTDIGLPDCLDWDPQAHTATQKLQMHGRTISMENIRVR